MNIPDLNIPMLISVGFFLVLCLFFVGILNYIQSHIKKQRLMAKIRTHEGDEVILDPDNASSQREVSFKQKILNFFIRLGRLVISEKSDQYSSTKLNFLRAGFRKKNIIYVFWGAKLFLAAVLPVLFYLLRLDILKIMPPLTKLGIAGFLAVLGFYLPSVWLRLQNTRRKERLRDGIPDALDLLVVCVEAGLGLDSAVKRVGDEMKVSNRAISDEFNLLNLELRMGKSRQSALRNLAQRADIEEFSTLTSLLIQAEKFGTSIAPALRVCADGFRKERFRKAEEKAAKMAVKMTFPLIFCIFPSLFVAILGSTAIQVYHLYLKFH
jgi:tight adherence protein C